MSGQPKRGELAAQKTPEGGPSRRSGGERPGIIVVPLDGSAEAKLALPPARLAARLAGCSIHVVYAAERPLTPEELLRQVGLRRQETAGLVLDQVVGAPAESIVRFAAAEHALLIVMTTRGKTAYLGRTVRPVPERVIASAGCPVLLIRPEIGERVATTTSLRRVLLPLDGAPSSAEVIGFALDLARWSGAEVDLLFVATRATRPSEPGSLAGPLYVDQPQYEWPTWALEFTSRFGTSLGQCQVPSPAHLFLRPGDPAAEILRLAGERHSDLIVLEWRGRMDPAHARVVKGVLTDAPCPVLLIRTSR